MLIRFLDSDAIDDDFIFATEEENFDKFFNVVKSVGTIKIKEEYYKYDFAEVSVAQDENYVNCVNIYVHETA